MSFIPTEWDLMAAKEILGHLYFNYHHIWGYVLCYSFCIKNPEMFVLEEGKKKEESLYNYRETEFSQNNKMFFQTLKCAWTSSRVWKGERKTKERAKS